MWGDNSISIKQVRGQSLQSNEPEQRRPYFITIEPISRDIK